MIPPPFLGNFSRPFENKPNEDLPLLETLDKFLADRRGFVVKLPPAGSDVAACMSGGLDSTATILILLQGLGYKVHPFFINRGQGNLEFERKAVRHYDDEFAKRFPGTYSRCVEISIDTPGAAYKGLLTKSLRQGVGYPSRNTIIFMTGAEFAYALSSRGVHIKTVFGATVSSDGLHHSSLTWIRTTNLAICQAFNDYSWQLISLPVERSLGNHFDKDVLILQCESADFDLSQTRTCTETSETQCGKCAACFDRRRCFVEAGVTDKTKYLP